MELTRGQELAIKTCVERYRNKEAYTTIAGYAGTGKSTSVQYIIEALGIPEDRVVYATLTGKAALVLRNKGCSNTMTLHKLLYIPKKIPNTDEVEFIPREFLENNPLLIVVDEASMVSKEIFELLLSHKVHIIFLGDNFQLPPISESADILDHPHVTLTEITRQALDSPIIRLSMDIREGNPLVYGGPKEARVMSKNKVSEGLLLGADIVLCGKNETRHKMNQSIRKLKWGSKFQEGPINGDKLIALKNYWKITDTEDETPLVNGMIGTISRIHSTNTKLLSPKITARFVNEIGEIFDKTKINIDYQMLTKHEPTVNSNNWKEFYKVQKPLLFDYADCVTVHKYQGSQADKVLIFAEVMGSREDYYRWLYTACTRAAEKCVIVI
jgi:exodeoxyribonuclease-5